MKQNRNDQVHSPRELLQRIANAYQKLWVPASTQPVVTKKIWARVGVTMTMTEEEFLLIQKQNKEATEMLRNKLLRHEYVIDGETYFPGLMDEREDEWFYEGDIEYNF